MNSALPLTPNLMIEKGNIDLSNRPPVRNDDGSISTIRSMSYNEDGAEVLIPTIVDGRAVSDEEAIDHYHKTGQHLGRFPDVRSANQAAELLHQLEEKRMPFTDQTQTETPSRARAQFVKPVQTLNSGLTRPTTPNNPTASRPSSAPGASAAPVYPDALSTTRRQMARDAVDSMTDEQLSQVLALANGTSQPTTGVTPEGVARTPGSVISSGLMNGLSQTPTPGREGTSAVPSNPMSSAGPLSRMAPGKLAQQPRGLVDGEYQVPVGGALQGIAQQPSRHLSIPWMNE